EHGCVGEDGSPSSRRPTGHANRLPVPSMLYESPIAGHDKIAVCPRSTNDRTDAIMMSSFNASLLLTAALAAADSPPGSFQLTPTTEVRFAAVDEGRTILTANDPFAASLSRFDLQCRLK